MKNCIWIISFACILAAFSCSRNNGYEPELSGIQTEFNATWAEGASKTAIQPDGTTVWWTVGERINIFSGTKYSGLFTSDNTEPQATVKFNGTLYGPSGTPTEAYWAIYPYNGSNVCNGQYVTLAVPSEQQAVAGTFADKMFPAVAKSDTHDLMFKYVCGGARFSVTRPGISRIVFRSILGMPLSGTVKVDFSSSGVPEVLGFTKEVDSVAVVSPEGGFLPGEYYYAAILPGEYLCGFDLEFRDLDNLVGYRSLDNDITVRRAFFGKVDNIDDGVDFTEYVDPRTNINGTFIDFGNDLAGVVTDSSTGKGIPGVVVSDSYNCVTTDANGVYQFKSNSRTRLVFVSVPSEYKVPVGSYKSVPLFYKTVTPDGSLKQNDFSLDPLPGGKETSWTFVGIGDPQCETNSNANRYINETISDIRQTLTGKSNVYAMTLGDIVFDSSSMWDKMKSSMSSVNTGEWYIPFFQTIGNHDHDSLKPDTSDNVEDDYQATSTFVGAYGPVDYSFNRGDVHIVSMDDIIVQSLKSSSRANKKTWEYDSGFSDAQLEWLKQDLNLVPDKSKKMLFICCHIPFRGSTKNHYNDVKNLMKQFKEAHLMIGHTHYTQNYIHTGYVCQGGLPLYEHVHGSACGAWWTASGSSTVTGEPSGYTIYDIEGAHIKDWRLKGTKKVADFQFRVFDGNDIYGSAKTYPLNWYTASQTAGSSSISVKGNTALAGCFVVQVFNDDGSYWKVDLVQKSTGKKIGSFKRLSDGACCNIAAVAWYFNYKGKNSDSYTNKTASHYWYYKPASGTPADETDWEVVVTQTLPAGDVVHTFTSSTITKESDFTKTFYY